MAVARVAVKRGIGRNQNAFDERMVVQPPEKFLRGVASTLRSIAAEDGRALFADEFECLKRKVSFNFSRSGLGRFVIVPARDAMDIKAIRATGHAILGLLPGGELRFQFLARQRFDVLQHPRNLTGAGRETKTLRNGSLMECKSGLQFKWLVLIVNLCHEMARLSAGRVFIARPVTVCHQTSLKRIHP